jgi:hypothetical protein
MTTQYSILSVLIRPEIQEKITIGFLLMDDEKVFFNYSKIKLAASKNLLSVNAYTSLKDALHNINATAECHNYKEQPINLISEKAKVFKKSYIEYLSRYNNNILSFSSPKDIELDATLDIFSKLYRKFIDNTIPVEKKQFTNFIQRFKQEKRQILSKHFNIDEKVTNKDIPALIVPVTITLLGQNEVPTFVQSLDFEKRTDFLSNDISEILYLQRAFNDEKKGSIAMSITNEPDKSKFPQQHDIWRQLRNTSGIIHFDISEAEKVIEYAEKHNVHPFLSVEK